MGLQGNKPPKEIGEAVLDGRKYVVYDRMLEEKEGDGWVVARWNQGFWVSVTIEPFIVYPSYFVELHDDVV